MTASSPDDGRAAELVSALGSIRSRIAAACGQAGRDPRQVTLIAVTKTRPASDIAALAGLGVLDVGESKDQEARAKIAELAELADSAGLAEPAVRLHAQAAIVDLRWHLVGRLQTNKARSVARYAHAVHSVDRVKLVTALADAAGEADRRVEVFVQVSLDADPDRGGAAPADLAAVADAVAARDELVLRGVMTVPPVGSDAGAAFARLAGLAAELRARHPGADAISAGMSDDLEAAIVHGATHVRVGSALLGRRTPTFG